MPREFKGATRTDWLFLAQALFQQELETLKAYQIVLKRTLVSVLGLNLTLDEKDDPESFIPAVLLMSHPRIAEALGEQLAEKAKVAEALAQPEVSRAAVERLVEEFDEILEHKVSEARVDALREEARKVGVREYTPADEDALFVQFMDEVKADPPQSARMEQRPPPVRAEPTDDAVVLDDE
jgi:hypothetical protein